MGRPLGSKNKNYDDPILIQSWVPLKWQPVYETKVALHIAGKSNIYIGEALDYTPTQVGNILRSPEALAIKRSYIERVRENTSTEIPEQLEELKRLAVNHLKTLLEDTDKAKEAPFAMANFSMGFLKGIGTLSDGGAKVTNNTLIAMSPQAQVDLVKGLMEANEVKRLHSGESNDE